MQLSRMVKVQQLTLRRSEKINKNTPFTNVTPPLGEAPLEKDFSKVNVKKIVSTASEFLQIIQ